MRLLLFLYLIVTALLAGRLILNGSGLGGGALLIGSLLGFAGGSGTRGSFYRCQKRSGIAIGLTLILAGMAAAFYSDVVLRIFGSELSGDVWVALGSALGFFAARPEDAGVGTAIYRPENENALSAIAPIAAAAAAGRLTPDEAERRIRGLAQFAPEAPGLWQSMNAKEREELGLNLMRLAANPEFMDRIGRHFEPMKETDPDLWEQSLAKARDELGNGEAK